MLLPLTGVLRACMITAGGVVPYGGALLPSLVDVSSLSEYESKVGEMRPLPPASDAGAWYHIAAAAPPDVTDDVERALSDTDDDDDEYDDVDRALLVVDE